MTDYVIDTSAVIAFLVDERGGNSLVDYLPQSGLSVMNYAELVRHFQDRLSTPEIALTVDDLGLELLPVTRTIAEYSGELNYLYRKSGLSYCDCACLSTGMMLNATVITADGPWLSLDRSRYKNTLFRDLKIVNLREE